MSLVEWRRQSLRVESGAIRTAPGQDGQPAASRRIVLLVHGFNNDKQQAEESYDKLIERLRGRVHPHLLEHVWQFFWPGYVEALAGRLRRTRYDAPSASNQGFTAASYGLQVPKARTFGKLLGEYLLRLGATEVILIGHSLGCRLILEALRVFETAGGNHLGRIPAVCLMAAAVPTEMLESGAGLCGAAGVPARSYVLYSRQDWVLQWTFPPGQWSAREGHSEAVGRWGHPRPTWTATDETMLGHTEYYEEPVTTPHLVRLFGVATREALPEFQLVKWEAPPPQTLPSNSLPSEHLPSRNRF